MGRDSDNACCRPGPLISHHENSGMEPCADVSPTQASFHGDGSSHDMASSLFCCYAEANRRQVTEYFNTHHGNPKVEHLEGVDCSQREVIYLDNSALRTNSITPRYKTSSQWCACDTVGAHFPRLVHTIRCHASPSYGQDGINSVSRWTECSPFD